jgi:beta-lactamase regulating signal transducer with metallopeptidase domain
MNLPIEAMNFWADHALRFAWPMLWQSSLLIGLLFALDLVMRRRLRPAVRYALWLVVLVKFLVPPSLAFPTGPGWWLRMAKAAPAQTRSTSVMVSYGPTDTPVLTAPAMPVFVAPPRPRLTQAAWALLGTVTVSLGLLAWMLARWHQVARDARRATVAPARLSELLPEPRRPVRLRLTDQPQSPAVCGLFRPVILLPRTLAEQLPPAQLRAVLLHELLHLRRGDVWVNCAQALLQIVYWWHPLLWFANARIRRVREEAVDDAVMVALNEDAEAYAPTLLEVAKLALHRPLASLGLVGILESRSSLRQRIERLMDFHPPRRAGLTLASGLAVLGFAALAVPMGEAPAPTEIAQPSGTPITTNSSVSNSSSSASSLDQKANAIMLTRDGKLLYEMHKLDEAEAKLKQALKEDPHNAGALYYLNVVSEAKFAQANPIRRELLPIPNPSSHTNLVRTSPARQAMLTKLDRIRLDSVFFDGQPLSEVVRILNAETRKRDPEKRGINFLVNQSIDRDDAVAATAPVLGPDGNPLPAPSPERVDMGAIAIKINPPLTNIRLADVLDAIVAVADRPIKYSIADYAIIFSLRGRETTPLYVRTFKVDPKTILESLHKTKHPEGTNGPGATVVAALRELFASVGVDLDPVRHPGKALFFKDRQGMLLVRATLQDLDIIGQVLAVLDTAPPQIGIQVRFIEVPDEVAREVWGNSYLTNGAGTQSRVAVLTTRQAAALRKKLESLGTTNLLGAPEITTLSGRQVQVRMASTQRGVTGINEGALTPPGITATNKDERALYETNSIGLWPTLDVIPSVLADGYTISLTLIPALMQFRGYDNPNDALTSGAINQSISGGSIVVPTVLPRFTVRQVVSTVNVWDGQTVVLGDPMSETMETIKDQVPMLGDLPLVGKLFRSESKTTNKKKLLIFLTPTLIDPAGNRLHTEEEMPFARDRIPSQPAHDKENLLRFVSPLLIDPASNRVHSEQEMPLPRNGIPPQPPR